VAPAKQKQKTAAQSRKEQGGAYKKSKGTPAGEGKERTSKKAGGAILESMLRRGKKTKKKKKRGGTKKKEGGRKNTKKNKNNRIGHQREKKRLKTDER